MPHGPIRVASGYRHQRRNRPHQRGPRSRIDCIASPHFQNSAAFIEGVRHAADRGRSACLCASPPTFTQAAVRFVVSFAALIGLSLLLAGL